MSATGEGRASGEAARREIKSAFRELVRACGGGDCAARATRVTASALSRFGSLDCPDFPAVDVICDLEIDLGAPVVSSRLARLAGYRLEPLSSLGAPSGPSGPGPAASAADHVATAAGLFSEIEAALRDGRIDAAARAAIATRMREALVALVSTQQALADLGVPA